MHATPKCVRLATPPTGGVKSVRENCFLSRPTLGATLTPAVLVSMNTGLRRGELLALPWESIDFSRRILTVEGGTAKNRQTRHVPLNDEAIGLLNRWRPQTHGGRRIFE